MGKDSLQVLLMVSGFAIFFGAMLWFVSSDRPVDPNLAIAILQSDGYTAIELLGSPPFGTDCGGRLDYYRTEWRGVKGDRQFRGVACSDFSGGMTIRVLEVK